MRIWFRYMPVRPTSASAAISTLSESRTPISVVWIEMAFSCGWLIWTPMKIAPAAAAAMPAHRVRRFGVMVMSGPFSGWSVAGAAGIPRT